MPITQGHRLFELQRRDALGHDSRVLIPRYTFSHMSLFSETHGVTRYCMSRKAECMCVLFSCLPLFSETIKIQSQDSTEKTSYNPAYFFQALSINAIITFRFYHLNTPKRGLSFTTQTWKILWNKAFKPQPHSCQQ